MELSVLGLGSMGRALARTLLEAGHGVTVWNRTLAKAEPLVAAGARLAESPAEAIASSAATIVCIRSHAETLGLFEPLRAELGGRTIVELSTGSAGQAEQLADLLEAAGADWMIGIIHGFPSAIGRPDTVLTCVSEPETWLRWSPVVRALGGASRHVGTEAGMLAALFAALFVARQGFLFGMIYGGVLCRAAGIPLDLYAAQVPTSMGVLPSYHRHFSESVPPRAFDDPPATMATVHAALDDALRSFERLGASDALPRLLEDLTRRAVEAGHGEQAVTKLVELLSE